MAVQTSALAKHVSTVKLFCAYTEVSCSQGYITKQQRSYLNEIYKRNPLAFDFVVRPCLHLLSLELT